MVLLLCALVAMFVGVILQRVSGMGVGLVVAPVLSLLMGPGPGVLATNAATTCSAFTIALSVRKRVEWKHAGVIIGLALPGIVLGALVVTVVPGPWLQVGVGAVVLLALAITNFSPGTPRASRRRAVVPAAVIGGFFNSTAGIAAPAMVIYSRITRWDQLRFAATMQPVFMSMGALSALSKIVAGVPLDLPVPLLPATLALLATIALGMVAGTWLAHRMSKGAAQKLAMALAALGGVVVLVRGFVALIGG